MNYLRKVVNNKSLIRLLLKLYSMAIILICFLPQEVYPHVKMEETPGIVHYGRIVVLLMPFNSFFSAHQLKRPLDVYWLIQQNIANIFLLFPLLLAFLILYPKLRSWRKVLILSFLVSLGIEFGQVILDIVIDANRVFETDDLLMNTLGGLLAYLFYLFMVRIGIFRK